MKYLIDTSALVRVLRRQVEPVWHEHIEHGVVAVCEPVLTETLTTANAKSYAELEESLLAAYPWVPVPDDAWEAIRALRRRLAVHSVHQGLSVADCLVVASAMRHRLTVLHEDRDYETVARHLPEFRQTRISRRS